MRAYSYKYLVTFKDTNLVGNVYFANYVLWQGACRESFLQEEAPTVLEQLKNGLCIVTTRCACEYLSELFAFDQVTIEMRLLSLMQNRLTFSFEYWRGSSSRPELVARGEQQVAFMQRVPDGLRSTTVPSALAKALEPYSASAGVPLAPTTFEQLVSGQSRAGWTE